MQLHNIVQKIRIKHPNGCIIGITGKGASGKSTLASSLNKKLNQNYGATICFDQFLEPHQIRYNKNNKLLTGYHPKTFDYNKATLVIENKLESFSKVNSKYLIFEGVSAMHYGLKEFYDLTIFLDCSSESENERRNKRVEDKIRLLYMKNKKKELFKARNLQFEKYIQIHKNSCDISLFSNQDFTYKVIH